MSDVEITSCNSQERAEYLAEKYYISPITLFENNIKRNLSRIKIKKENSFRKSPDGRDFLEVDGIRITFKIQYDGNPELFELQPSTCILSSFDRQSFEYPCGENYGSFTLVFDYEQQDFQDRGDAMAEYLQTKFESKFRGYRQMISYINDEVQSYNAGLISTALKFLDERKKKADSLALISAALQIPLTESENAPNTVPIKLKRVVRAPVSKPTVFNGVPEFCISDGDYENINNIIAMCGTTMEKTARTYFANTEEELRDHLLAALNTHYEAAATGETFRKIGKTDIHIEFENKAAFIGECKLWHGESFFKSAIQQVINYSTWRDVKVSVIIFNKDNKNFPAILSKIQLWVEANTISYIQPQANVWKCKYHRQDMNIDIQLSILIFDLYVDKSQFKDSRYINK